MRRLRSLLFLLPAAGSLIALTALATLPALPDAGGGRRTIILVSAAIIGVQVGQTVATQYILHSALARIITVLAWSVALLLGAVLLTTSLAQTVLATCLGAALGIITTGQTARYMLPGTLMSYQNRLLQRNALWLLLTGALVLTHSLGRRSFVAVTLVTWLVVTVTAQVLARRLARQPAPVNASAGSHSSATPGSRGLAGLALIVYGTVASLVYRNDSNILRERYLHGADFLRVHYALLGYTTVNGLLGFAVLQLLYPRLRAANLAAPEGNSSGLSIGTPFISSLRALTALSAIGLIAALALPGGSSRFVALAVLVLASTTATTLLSALCHAQQASLYVYTAGLAGIAVLLVATRWSFAVALAWENVAVLVILGIRTAPLWAFRRQVQPA